MLRQKAVDDEPRSGDISDVRERRPENRRLSALYGYTGGPMDTDAILRELIAQTDRPLALAEAEVKAAQEKVEKLRAERYGLELALARHRGEPAPTQPRATHMEPVSPSDPDIMEWQRLSRTDAALRVLEEAGKPVHRKTLQAELHARGRDDSLDHMSAALAYLNRRGRAISKGYGMWVHPDHDHQEPEATDPQEAEDPAEAGSSKVSLMPSERRTTDDAGDRDRHPAPVVGA